PCVPITEAPLRIIALRRLSRLAVWKNRTAHSTIMIEPLVDFTDKNSTQNMKRLVAILTLLPSLMASAVEMQKFASHFALQASGVPTAVKQEAKPQPWDGKERGPVAGLKVYAKEKSGAVWLGSEQGAARFDPKNSFRWDRWQYFYGRRWLLDNEVKNIVVDETGSGRKVWIRTKTGISLIEWRPMTLEQKAKIFDDRVEKRHVRHGMVANSGLRVAGDLSSNVNHDNDNDGLWTAMYLGAEAF